MKYYSKGAVTLFIVIISIIILSGIAGAVYINRDSDVKIDPILKEEIIQDIAEEIRKSGVLDTYEITVENATDGHARLSVLDPKTNITKTLFSIKVDGEWKVIKTEDVYSCERMSDLGFPDDMISDCTLEYPDAVSVATAIDTLANSTGDSVQVNVLGKVIIPKELDCNCIYIESGGKEIKIDLTTPDGQPSPYDDLEVGDTVVVVGDITIPNPPQNIPTNTTTDTTTDTTGGDGSLDTSSNTDNDTNSNTSSNDNVDDNNQNNTPSSPVITPIVIDEIGEDVDEAVINPPDDTNNPDDGGNGGTGGTTGDNPTEPNIPTEPNPDDSGGGSGGNSNNQNNDDSFFNIFDLNKNNEIQLKND